MSSLVYYGSKICSAKTGKGTPCVNKAYWFSNNSYLCGIHSKSDSFRKELPKNPNVKADRAKMLIERRCYVEEIAADNRAKGLKGNLICSKIRMMKEVDHFDGYLKVFPNFKHQNRSDGFGCMSLSPKAMGPVEHGQPLLPPASNLENMWQGSKCFAHETGPNGYPNDQFYQSRLAMYLDKIPHRHKKFLDGSNAKGNIPNYSVWNEKEGYENFLEYGESRQIYCHFYEKIAKTLPDFHELRQLLNDGYNIQICGYDGYPVTKSLDYHYKDTSRPFGHEMVLFSLLSIENGKEYPWRKFQTLSL